ncbi:hypothetical protein M0R45_026272 [Rubus argutus]|uniref:Uncharacterized protein n=1 Tax=Rubus argutus TaxID=59490 RepID=A0AAW1WYU5_RUBAR
MKRCGELPFAIQAIGDYLPRRVIVLWSGPRPQTTPEARASIKATVAPSISTRARAQLFFRPPSPTRILASDAVVSPTTSSLAFLHYREPRSGHLIIITPSEAVSPFSSRIFPDPSTTSLHLSPSLPSSLHKIRAHRHRRAPSSHGHPDRRNLQRLGSQAAADDSIRPDFVALAGGEKIGDAGQFKEAIPAAVDRR